MIKTKHKLLLKDIVAMRQKPEHKLSGSLSIYTQVLLYTPWFKLGPVIKY